jgi:hypothetical protein
MSPILKFLFLIFTNFKIFCLHNKEKKENTTKKNIYIQPNYTSYFINSTIKTLNNKNFDSFINNDNYSNYLILFTFRRCPICNKLIRITENTEKYYSLKNNTNFKFAKVDCYENWWTAMRFDIFKLPIYIYISKGKFASFIPYNITEEKLIAYIEGKDKIYKSYPSKIGYFGVLLKIFHHINEKIQTKISFWNEAYGCVVLFILFGSFLYFEYSLYRGCCDNHKNNNEEKNHIHKENNKKKIKKE